MDAVNPKLRSPRIFVVVSVAVLILLLGTAGWRYTHPRRMVSGPYIASLLEIRKLVAYPKTATYSRLASDPAATVHLRHDGDYEVTGWVEEENDYGHRVRRDWRCVVHHQSGDHWLPIYVRLDQFTAGTYVPDAQ
jgi:hypothetical protein